MDQVQLDKIQLELSRMDDGYWSSVADGGTQLSEQATLLTARIKDACTKLAITQMDILENKRSGYERLIENKNETANAKIVSENKERIDALNQEKQQVMATLSNLLTELMAVIKEIQKLGRVPLVNGGETHG